jgi:hypothetical protein
MEHYSKIKAYFFIVRSGSEGPETSHMNGKLQFKEGQNATPPIAFAGALAGKRAGRRTVNKNLLI